MKTGRRAGILEGGGMADAAAMKVIKTTAGRSLAPELGNLEESQRQERARVASHPAASEQPSAQSSSGPEGHQKFRSPGKPNTYSRGPEGSRKSRPATSRATERSPPGPQSAAISSRFGRQRSRARGSPTVHSVAGSTAPQSPRQPSIQYYSGLERYRKSRPTTTGVAKHTALWRARGSAEVPPRSLQYS